MMPICQPELVQSTVNKRCHPAQPELVQSMVMAQDTACTTRALAMAYNYGDHVILASISPWCMHHYKRSGDCVVLTCIRTCTHTYLAVQVLYSWLHLPVREQVLKPFVFRSSRHHVRPWGSGSMTG